MILTTLQEKHYNRRAAQQYHLSFAPRYSVKNTAEEEEDNQRNYFVTVL